MIDMNLYKEVDISEVGSRLDSAFKESEKSYIQLAAEMGLKSTTTCENILKYPTKVSDKVLTMAMEILNVDGFVMTKGGEKKFYIQK